MDKINFENLPSTNTPINAENLNQMQDNVENAISELVDNLFYKSGELFEASNLICIGHLTSSSKQVVFSIPTEKKLDNINTISINSMVANIRHPDGGYIVNGNELTTIGTVTATKGTNNIIRAVFSLTTASNLENNCPVSIDIRSSVIEFS